THSFLTIARFADYFDLRIILQDAPESVPHQRMIVHQQHRELIPHDSRLSGDRYAGIPSCLRRPVAIVAIFLRLFPRVHASPPIQSRGHFSPTRFLFHGLPLPVPAHQQEISAAPTPLSLLNAGLHYSALPAKRGRRARSNLRRGEKPSPIFHSAAQAPTGAPPSEYTNPACSPVQPLREAPDAGLAKGCEYYPESIAQFRAPLALLRALSSLQAIDSPRVPAATQWPSAPVRIRRAIRAKYAAAWTPVWKSIFAPAHCAARKAPPALRK